MFFFCFLCFVCFFVFFFKQKTAYEIRPRDWSSDVCSSDLMSLTIEVATNDAGLVGVFNGLLADLAGLAPVAVCAGNDNADVTGYTPANSDHDNVYTVASIDSTFNLASDSNDGEGINFVAPGVGIESLKPGGGTWFWSGCSMATPHVAAILLINQTLITGTVIEGVNHTYPLVDGF